MVVIGGPSGSGKSTAFPVAESGVEYFNVDDVAASINGGSYQNLSPEIRAEANRRCERFIAEHIRDRKSFAIETTLRTGITFQQAELARTNGFEIDFTYIAVEDVNINIERIAARADRGGHSASLQAITEIYNASLKNFPRAVREFDYVTAFDNSELAEEPRLVLESVHGRVTFLASEPPRWLERAMKGTEFEMRGWQPPFG